MWSRYFKPINCPDWFVEGLPKWTCLDGELWCGRQRFNQTVSTVKKLVPVEDEWLDVNYHVFDMPAPSKLFEPGVIRVDVKNSHTIPSGICKSTVVEELSEPFYNMDRQLIHEAVVGQLRLMNLGPHAQVHQQYHLSSWDAVDEFMEAELELGGEGIMMRRMNSVWTPKRSDFLLKFKPWEDAEAVVIGWTAGKERLEGMMGSLKMRMPNGKEFDMSGFTDDERELLNGEPRWFKIGQKLTYKFRELTPDGIPKENRYFRPHSGI
jgi:DNA ligase-1